VIGAYITSRKLPNDAGEKTDSVVMWRKKREEAFHYALTCPYCGTEQAARVLFNRRPYRVQCYKCGKSIVIEKLPK
jgi:ribosomal protein S27E